MAVWMERGHDPFLSSSHHLGEAMWIKTKKGYYVNFDYVSFLYQDPTGEWIICEHGDGFSQVIDDDTAKRLIENISKNLF